MTADTTRSDPRSNPAPSYYRPDVQGLRAVAVLMVVAYHAGGYLPGGFVGVDVFFVISGFVIGQLLHRELEATGTIDFRRFYLRRIRRILPASAVLLAVVLPLSAILAPIGGLDGTQRTGFTAALFNANNYLMYWGGTGGGYFDASAETNALLHMWSLAVEEQFYLVFPFILWAAWRATSVRGFSTGAVRIALVIVCVISFVLSWLLVTERFDPLGAGDRFAFYSAPSRAWQFAVGALLAMGVGTAFNKSSTTRLTSAVAGVALVGYAGLFYDTTTTFPGIAALAPTIGTALLIGAATSSTSNPISKLLAIRPMQTIGDISYSWYLWHWPIIVFAVAYNQTADWVPPAAAAVSSLPAIASYRFVENPLRHAQAITTPRTLALGAACIAIPIAASAFLYIATPRIQDSEAARAFAEHIDVAKNCDSRVPLARKNSEQCIWAVDNPVGTAVLIGDSNAGHFSEGFISAANHLKMNAIVRTASGCPFIDISLIRDGVEQTDCSEFVASSIEGLAEVMPTVVAIALAPDRYIFEEDFAFVLADGDLAESTSGRLAAWGPALETTLERIRFQGTDVILIHPSPRALSDGRAPNASWLAFGRGYLGVKGASRADIEAGRRVVVEIERSAANQVGAVAVDFFDEICTQEVCEIIRDGSPVYRDQVHISVSESVRLTEHWLSILSEPSSTAG